MAISHKCFMCTEKILGIDSRHQNSFRLFCEIVELPQYGNNVNKSEIGYCHRCEQRILNIRDMFEELEKLEKKILDEKHLMELQFKENVQKYHPENSSEKLKAEIVTELSSTSIESMLEKIRKKKVGRKMRSQRRIRIMQGVTIPKLTTPKTPKPIQECAEKDLIGTTRDNDQEHISQESQPGHNTQQRFADVNDWIEEETRDTVNDTTPHEPLNSWNICNFSESGVKFENVTVEYPTVFRDHLDDAVAPLDFELQTHSIGGPSELTQEVGNQFEEANFLLQQVPEGAEINRTIICGDCETCFDNYDELNSHECTYMNNNGHSAAMMNDETRLPQKRIKNKNNRQISQSVQHQQNRNCPSTSSTGGKQCDECGKIFLTVIAWKHHVLSKHRGQSTYNCTICDYGTMRRMDMMTHMSKHSTVRSYKCPLCDKTFKHKPSRSRHIRTHKSGENIEVQL